MSRTPSVLETFPVETRLPAGETVAAFRATYDRIRGIIGNVERQARLRDAAARGLITLPSKKRGHFIPAHLPGPPLSKLLNEVRD